MKTMSKSAKKLFIAMACVSMLLTFFVGCKQPNNGGGLLNRKSLLNSKKNLTSRLNRKNLPKSSC